jgi:signal transduction histidine kinase
VARDCTGTEYKRMTMQTEPLSPTIPGFGPPGAVDGKVVLRDRSPRLLASITALVWLIPLLLLAVAAWQTWRLEIDEAGSEVQNVLTMLADQTEQVFQSQSVALELIDKHTKGWTWDEIERSAALNDFITSLDKSSDYFDSVFLADGDGRARMTEHHFPSERSLNASVSDRDYFIAAKDARSDTYVGRPMLGKLSGRLLFRVARRRSSADGSFDGIIAVGLAPKYFEEFFAKLIRNTASTISISRDDGVILARNSVVPRTPSTRDGQPSLDLIAFDSREPKIFTSTLDDVERLGAARKLRNYPIFVTYAIDMQAIRTEWLDRLKPFGIAALSSSLVLILLSLYVRRIAHGERMAHEAWQEEVRNRLRREAQVRQALKMEALGRLAGGIAHHFNNLLPAMSGLLEMTRAEVPAESDAARRLERMIRAVDQGRGLVRQILTFSHRSVPLSERISVPALVDDAIAFAEGSLPRSIRLLTEQNYGGAVMGDPSQLRDVLLNLISNASYAIGTREGTIIVATESRVVDVETGQRLGVRAGPFVRIECRDDGVGMTEDVLERAFEPFFTTKPPGEGSGLGLAIVHGVIVGHGGAVELHSRPATGSRFSLYLPAICAA